jgi:hypothetical protein
MQFFLGYAGYSKKVAFDSSMMAHFHKKISDEELKDISELMAQRGKKMLTEAFVSQSHGDSIRDDKGGGIQLLLDSLIKTEDSPEEKNGVQSG